MEHLVDEGRALAGRRRRRRRRGRHLRGGAGQAVDGGGAGGGGGAGVVAAAGRHGAVAAAGAEARPEAEQRAHPVRAHVDDRVCVADLLQVPVPQNHIKNTSKQERKLSASDGT